MRFCTFLFFCIVHLLSCCIDDLVLNFQTLRNLEAAEQCQRVPSFVSNQLNWQPGCVEVAANVTNWLEKYGMDGSV